MNKINLADDRKCPHCGRYKPRSITVCTIIQKENKVLLIKRGIDPFKGTWAFPGGYISWGENADKASVRETKEETGLDIIKQHQHYTYTDPSRSPKQGMMILYICDQFSGNVKAGDDAQDAQWFNTSDLPKEMAYDHKQVILDLFVETRDLASLHSDGQTNNEP